MISKRFSRQSFLGEDGQAAIERCLIGLVGLGGGGSHIVQQFAHVGFLNYTLFDGDHADESNLNRLVVATEADVAASRLKVEAARDRILAVRGTARIEAIAWRWQDRPEALRRCDLVFGCVDSFAQRSELEASCRQYLIPYIDIGMDLHQAGDEPPVMGGQVILSMPDGPCMFCMGFLDDEKLGARQANTVPPGDGPKSSGRTASSHPRPSASPSIYSPTGPIRSAALSISPIEATTGRCSRTSACGISAEDAASTTRPIGSGTRCSKASEPAGRFGSDSPLYATAFLPGGQAVT